MGWRQLAALGSAWLLGLAAGAASGAQPHPIEQVDPAAIEAWVAASKGNVIVNVTSTDPNCGYCAQANRKFEQLSQRHDLDGDVRLVQVAWQPWNHFPEAILPMLQRHGVAGIPVRLIFEDGQFRHKVVGVPPDLGAESPRRVSGDIPLVDRRQIADRVANSRGLVVVQLTSFDTTCVFCMRANPIFEGLVRANADPGVTYLRVDYQPWTGVGSDPFAQSVGGAGLPVYLTYQDGKQVRSKVGSWEAAELRQVLLDGLR